jgi:type IV secretory pathway VirB6-like protein
MKEGDIKMNRKYE